MMILLDVFDWSFSDSLVHKFSAPEMRHPGGYQCILQTGWTKNSLPDPIELSATDHYLAHPWRSTPLDPRTQHLPGNGAWGGSAPATTPWTHEARAAALTGCCWTALAQSRALPAQMTAAGLRKEQEDDQNRWSKSHPRVALIRSKPMPVLPFM